MFKDLQKTNVFVGALA